MTHFIHIEPNTAADAVRQRLARSGSGPVAVVLPPGWGELNNLARLRLLQRQARTRQQELALVTQDFATRESALKLGIPVYSSEASAMGRTWRMGREMPVVDPRNPAAGLPEPPPWRKNGRENRILQDVERPSLRRGRRRRIQAEERYRRFLSPGSRFWLQLVGYVMVAILLGGLLGGFAYYVLPAATVTVVPGQRAIEATARITADPAAPVVDVAAGIIPARLIESYIEVTGSTPTTGREQSQTDLARGSVVFTNQSNRAVTIPAGTIISTSTGDRVDFRTLNNVELAPNQGARATVNVEAMTPGTRGNVRANTITTVSGALRTQVQVTNPNATGGGASALVAVVKQEDRDRLLADVTAQIESQAYQRLLPELQEGEWMPPDSVQTFVIAQYFDHFNDEPAEELNLTLRILARGVGVDQRTAQLGALSALEREVPSRGRLVADSLRYFVNPEVTRIGNGVSFDVVAQGSYVIPVDAQEVRSVIVGLPPQDAASRLQQQLLLAGTPEFYLDPDWFGVLPHFGSRIQVRIDYAESLAQ